MSAKWERSKAWDDRALPSWAWPVKLTLRAFSSITLAVILLTLVSIYGVLASVPLGMLALAPTWSLYALSLVAAVGLLATPGVLLVRRFVPAEQRSLRFVVTFFVALALALVAIAIWRAAVWPTIRFDPTTGAGLRLFPGFVERYEATTVRRLPALEMTEGEFYAWWPLRLIFLLFVTNLIVATARRIEFRFVNLGVLTVHTGIVVLALGSMYYHTLKEEGDVLLIANETPGEPGPPVMRFWDRTRVALWASLDGGPWMSIPLRNVPRYNDYNIDGSDRRLDLPLPSIPPAAPSSPPIDLRISGYGEYVEMEEQWTRVSPDAATGDLEPLAELELISALPDEEGFATPRSVAEFRLPAGAPAGRIAALGNALVVEHAPMRDERRWGDLATPVQVGDASFAIIIETSDGERLVSPARTGDRFELPGVSVAIQSLHAGSPFPLITSGYEDADSSVAVVEITPDDGQPHQRWVYHRFPELNQDIFGVQADGRPDRRPADASSLRIALLDLTSLQVYLRGDEAIVRAPNGSVQRFDGLDEEGAIDIAPMVQLRITDRWEAAQRTERPVVVPEQDRQRDFVGTHDKAALAVNLYDESGWDRTIWLPFARFMNIPMGAERSVALPDGRRLRMIFGRVARALPGIELRLADFEMIPYPGSDIPRDYVSQLIVHDMLRERTSIETTRLNRPLIHKAPFQWRDERPALANALGYAASLIAPNQYKFSQAGWDSEGWRETAAEAEAGRRNRPHASFTILGVGNNPGIYIIAAGGVMISIGTPWAFYVKPWLLKRRKEKLKRLHKASAGAAPAASRAGARPDPVPAGAN